MLNYTKLFFSISKSFKLFCRVCFTQIRLSEAEPNKIGYLCISIKSSCNEAIFGFLYKFLILCVSLFITFPYVLKPFFRFFLNKYRFY